MEEVREVLLEILVLQEVFVERNKGYFFAHLKHYMVEAMKPC